MYIKILILKCHLRNKLKKELITASDENSNMSFLRNEISRTFLRLGNLQRSLLFMIKQITKNSFGKYSN